MASTACLVCFISTVNGHSNKKKERKEEAYPWKTSCSSRHITNLKQSILETFDIYAYSIVELLDRPENIKLARDKRSSLFCTGVSDE
jgi:hypothetical protein